MIVVVPPKFCLSKMWGALYIKKSTGIDVYDFPKSYTPFKYLKLSH